LDYQPENRKQEQMHGLQHLRPGKAAAVWALVQHCQHLKSGWHQSVIVCKSRWRQSGIPMLIGGANPQTAYSSATLRSAASSNSFGVCLPGV
jgi:hypothetical protein